MANQTKTYYHLGQRVLLNAPYNGDYNAGFVVCHDRRITFMANGVRA